MNEIIRQKSLKEQAYELIRDRIQNLEYPEGTILNERKLSEELQISRTPIREALKTLETEELVKYVPYKGVIVREQDLKEVNEIYQVRIVLESFMLELAVPEITEKQLKQMESYLEKQQAMVEKQEYDYNKFVALDDKFHETINQANPNETLRTLVTSFRAKIRQQALQSLYSGNERFELAVKEHRKILDSLHVRDVPGAQEAFAEHIGNAYAQAKKYYNLHK